MDITHEAARRLIQFSLDDSITTDKRTILADHLATCEACQTYSREVREVESVLRTAMRRRWLVNPLPLSLNTIRGQTIQKTLKSTILATRLVILSMFFAVLAFSIWQLGTPNQQENAIAPVAILPNPTPSLQATNTKDNSQVCQNIVYEVQPEDTLENLARRFAMDEESILEANNLEADAVRAGVELIVPICNSTPTITARPPTFTTTLAPLIQLTAYTPGQ